MSRRREEGRVVIQRFFTKTKSVRNIKLYFFEACAFPKSRYQPDLIYRVDWVASARRKPSKHATDTHQQQ